MYKWLTEIYAKCPIDGTIKKFCGQHIEAPTRKLAHQYCQQNGLGYLFVTDKYLVAENNIEFESIMYN